MIFVTCLPRLLQKIVMRSPCRRLHPQCIATSPMVHSKNICFKLTSSCVETYSFASYKSKQFVFVSHVVLNKTIHFAIQFGQYSSTVKTRFFARQNINLPNCLETINFRCLRLILNAIKATIKKKIKNPVKSL